MKAALRRRSRWSATSMSRPPLRASFSSRAVYFTNVMGLRPRRIGVLTVLSRWAYPEMAGNRFGDVATLPIASLRDYARSEARVYEELVPSRSLVLPVPPVSGGTDL